MDICEFIIKEDSYWNSGSGGGGYLASAARIFLEVKWKYHLIYVSKYVYLYAFISTKRLLFSERIFSKQGVGSYSFAVGFSLPRSSL